MFQFGIGGLFANPVGGNASTPSWPQQFATIQDVHIEISQKLVELMGQNKMPDDVAPSDEKITGKAGMANIQIDLYNTLFAGETTTTGGTAVTPFPGELGTVATASVTVTHSATWVTDLGVQYVTPVGNIRFLQRVASAPTAGQYSVAAGVYTFNATDNAQKVYICYTYTISATGRTLSRQNHLQGYGPVFEIFIPLQYQGLGNVLHMRQCRSSKIGLPFKRDGHLINDFEFTCYPDASGVAWDLYQTNA